MTVAKLANRQVKLLLFKAVLMLLTVPKTEKEITQPYWWVIFVRHAEEGGNINACQLLWIFIKIGKKFLFGKKEITSS